MAWLRGVPGEKPGRQDRADQAGTCNFEDKLNHAQAAGAAAAVVYDHTDEVFVNMSIGAATLPATFIRWPADRSCGTRFREFDAADGGGFQRTYAFARSADLSIFSSAGPTPAAL